MHNHYLFSKTGSQSHNLTRFEEKKSHSLGDLIGAFILVQNATLAYHGKYWSDNAPAATHSRRRNFSAQLVLITLFDQVKHSLKLIISMKLVKSYV